MHKLNVDTKTANLGSECLLVFTPCYDMDEYSIV